MEVRRPPRRWLFLALIPCPAGLTSGRMALPRPVRRCHRRPDPGADCPPRRWGWSASRSPPPWATCLPTRRIDQVGAERLLRSHRLAHLRCAWSSPPATRRRASGGGSPFPSSGFMGRSTLGLGYAVMLADLLLAPFTPSNTGRSAGVIYPILRGIPAPLRLAPGTDRPSGRRLPDVDRVRVHRRHQLALPDRPGAEPARGRDHPARRPGSRSPGPGGCWASCRSASS